MVSGLLGLRLRLFIETRNIEISSEAPCRIQKTRRNSWLQGACSIAWPTIQDLHEEGFEKPGFKKPSSGSEGSEFRVPD